jgi:hypothetical protein
MAVAVAAGTGGSVAAEEQPVRIVPFGGGAAFDLDEAIDNLECVLGFTSIARYHHYGLSGFAARLSETQLRRLERSGRVGHPLVERGSFLLRVFASDPAAAERTIAELERIIGFTVDLRFGRGDFRGWGAVLDWHQLLLLDLDSEQFGVYENPSGYAIWFVFEGLGGFYAILSNEQLAALSREPDLTTYTGDGGGGGSFYISGPIHLNCLQASRQDRKELAQAFAARIHI